MPGEDGRIKSEWSKTATEPLGYRGRVRPVPQVFIISRIYPNMDTIRQGLRTKAIEKDTYERLQCAACDERLKTRNDPDEIGSVRFCPECGREWKQIG